MAEVAEAQVDDIQEEEGQGEATPKKKWDTKRLLLFVVLPAVAFVLAGAAVYLVGTLSEKKNVGKAGAESEIEAAGPAVYLDLPEMLVNLNATTRRTSFLKIRVSLELENEADMEKLKTQMPRVMDQFQVYLRELRPEDLRGSAGLQRLREELLIRVRAAVEPVKVNDVLFIEMLVQ